MPKLVHIFVSDVQQSSMEHGPPVNSRIQIQHSDEDNNNNHNYLKSTLKTEENNDLRKYLPK